MSCCNGSTNLNSLLNRQFSTVNPLVNSFTSAPVLNPLTLTSAGYNLLNLTSTPVVNPLTLTSAGYNPLTLTSSPVVNPSTFTSVNSNAACNPLTSAMYTPLTAQEQSYTYNPQITSASLGSTPVSLSSSQFITTSNYIPSVSVPVPEFASRFVNYQVIPTSSYVNTCI